MVSDIRITLAVARVLRELLTAPSEPRYGYELMQHTGYASGKVYPILYRLLHAGWLTRTSEETDPSETGRPARYLYQLTPDGAEAARRELAALSQDLSLATADPSPRLRPHGGVA